MSAQLVPAGTVLTDRYLVDRYLNAGGMQQVYLCHDLALDRPVVLKIPKGGVSDRRFRRGAEMGARISHHNVAATFDYYEDDSSTFLIEEYVEGLDLAKRLAIDFNFLDPFLAAHVLHNITRALFEAHRLNVCHRDLKPNNIMVSSDPGLKIVKLTDFGIAKLAENEIDVEMQRFEEDESTLTSSNTLLGAVPYMAPECWADWRGAGQPMDIWALGCIAYQLVSGFLPFGQGRSAIAAVIRAEQTGRLVFTKPTLFGSRAATHAIEDQLWAFILCCINVDPAARPTAEQALQMCGAWCYPNDERLEGEIVNYRVPYSNGGVSQTGTIQDSDGRNYFFHQSEFFGYAPPKIGQRVSFSVYPGSPRARASPVLLLKD